MVDAISPENLAEMLKKYGSDYVEQADRNNDGIITITESKVQEMLHLLPMYDFDDDKHIEIDDMSQFLKDKAGLSDPSEIGKLVEEAAQFIPEALCELLNDPDVLPADKEKLGQYVVQNLPGKPHQECGPLIS